MTDPKDDLYRTGGALDAVPDLKSRLLSKLHGRVLSGYRITGLLGHGGMGYVFRALRAEGDFDRSAAIKIVPATLASSELAQRFRTEVQILATLNHPSIALLYDAGETEEGWPYLAMEYVDGEPIDTYCKTHNLSIERRLTLLSAITKAVRFAHARLIVHRDLKPSNVMVTRNGEPKLLDFGIAKLLEPGANQHTVAHRPMTPRYASPEQLLGSEITVGSDIYQLGILFLTVLGDETPFEDASLQDAIKRAASGRDARISERAREKMPADLAAIVSRCLHSDPDDRYADVNALLADLQNYSLGYPVTARKGSRFYRTRKLIMRNKPASAFASLAAIIAIGGGSYYTINLTHARDVAEARAETSTNLLKGMTQMLAGTYSELIESRGVRTAGQNNDPALQNEPLRVVLERTDRLIDSVQTDEPVIKAHLLHVQGLTNRQLFRLEDAESQLQESLALHRLSGDNDGVVEALIELAHVETYRGSSPIAIEFLDRAMQVADENVISPITYATLLATNTLVLAKLSRIDEAVSNAEKAVRILESLSDAPTSLLAGAYSQLASIYGELEDFKAARLWNQKTIDLYLEREQPSYRGLSSAYSGMAWSYVLSGDNQQAYNFFLKELEVSLVNFGERHIKTVTGRNNLGIALRRLGRYDEAIEQLTLAEKALLIIVPEDYWTFANIYMNLGNTYEDIGDLDRAFETFEKGLATTESGAAIPKQRAFLLNNSGRLLVATGQITKGQERLRAAVDAKSQILGPDHISTARSRLLLAQSQVLAGKITDAGELLEKAETVYQKTYGAEHKKLSLVELVKGQFLRSRQEYSLAREILTSAYRHKLEEYHEKHISAISVSNELALLELHAGDLVQAREWLARSEAGVSDLNQFQKEYIESRLIEAELLAAENRQERLASAKQNVTNLVRSFFPGRTDWTRRLDAI